MGILAGLAGWMKPEETFSSTFLAIGVMGIGFETAEAG